MVLFSCGAWHRTCFIVKVSIFDFTVHEVKTVWLPILILGYVLRSGRLLLLALTPMLFEILVGFGFMYFVSCAGMTISYYALMIMLMLIMALSWDYALFMLTRYKTEREAGSSVEEAVIQMVASSGSIVVVSGTCGKYFVGAERASSLMSRMRGIQGMSLPVEVSFCQSAGP